MPTAGRGGRVARGAGAVAAGLLLLVPGVRQAAPVGAATSFEALAAADGVRFTFAVPDAPVTDTPADAGGPSAQAALSTAGVSRAFAAQPYPGEAVVTGPGTVAGFTGGQLNPPAYPFAVTSDYPTVPEQSNDQGVYKIKATSAERRSDAVAHGGAAAGPVVDTRSSTAAADSGGAVAEAVSDVSGFAAGDVRIGRALSTARVATAADGSLSRSSDLSVTGFTIAGTAVGLGPAGLTVPGGTVPLPASDPVRAALASAGITVSYLAPVQQKSGVVAPGVAVSAPVTLPGGGRATVTYRLGQASASIGAVTIPGAGGLPPDGLGGDGGGVPSGSDGSGLGPSSGGDTTATSGSARPSSPAGPSGTAGSSGGVESGAAGFPTGAAAAGRGGATVGTSGAAGPAAGSGGGSAGAGSELLTAPVLRARGFKSASILLVLAAAGLVAFGLVTLFSALGVRRRWTS